MSRTDVNIYNEATGFTITSKSLGGRDFSPWDSSDPEWREAMREGLFLTAELVQDDSFGVRVVADEPLTEEEQAQWVDHWAAKLLITDGILTISGGIEYLWGEEMEDYTQYVPVAPGVYRVDFYTYIPGVNGWHCLRAAPEGEEPFGAYFRRTRPGEAFPYWLQADCYEEPEQDPGHEAEWEEEPEEDEDSPGYIDFLLHLTPLERLPPDEAPPAPPLGDPEAEDGGWIPIVVAPRKPGIFPTGLVSLAEADEEA
jgi:hypothetical protein